MKIGRPVGASLEVPVVPCFSPRLSITALGNDGLLAHGERISRVFNGAAYARLVAMVDGRTSSDALVDLLEGTVSAAEVYFALMQLSRNGVLLDRTATDDESTSVQGRRATSDESVRDGERTLQRALREAGINDATLGDLQLVVAAHYLDLHLAAINAATVQTKRAWLPCRISGETVWLGPLFRPGTTACWECLRHRLSINLPVDAWLAQRSPERAPIPAVADARSQSIAVELLARSLRPLTRGEGKTDLDNTLLTCDTVTGEQVVHRVQRRAQCPACGDPSLYAAAVNRPIQLASQRKVATADGGHRVHTADATIDRLLPYVDPLTGIVTSLRPITVGDGETHSPARAPMHVYVAGLNLARPTANFSQVRHALRRNSGGKGFTDAQAKASALGESVERYSAVYQGDEPRIRQSFRAFAGDAIAPNDCMLFSDAQFAARAERNTNPSRLERVPEPLDSAVAIDWSPVWSLTRDSHVHLPTSYLYFGYPHETVSYCHADSNGNAAGGTREEAILQGFLELVERDATALWWYNRIPRPHVDLATILGDDWQTIAAAYARAGRELWVLDLTTDLAIPSFVAVSRMVTGQHERILLGLGAHLDAAVGVRRAISELHQMLATVDGAKSADALEPDVRGWLADARVADHPYLLPDASRPRVASDYPAIAHADLRDDVRWCQRIVEERGLELLVLDQTRPDVGLPVVKVIVPGLRHFRVRMAPGRLYDVPVALGWLAHSAEEQSLNPVPFFL